MTRDDAALQVLAFNGGSSSLKFGLYRASAHRIEPLVDGAADGIGTTGCRFRANGSAIAAPILESATIAGVPEAIERIARLFDDIGAAPPSIVAHRIVHGGPHLRRHCRIDDAVLGELQAATAFAPLHAPQALAVVRVARDRYADALQVACLDTTFHLGMPDVARRLPLPRHLQSEGIERYGFHGLSCESIVRQLGDEALPPRLVIAHLGSGASVTAVRDGRSIDTSMGLTPSGGLVMATRSGDLDPGVLVYLMREKNLGATELEALLDRQSGLLGISDIDGDMRRLHDAAPDSADARLAIETFCYAAAKHIAAMIVALRGIDGLVFTGGIGENDPSVRASICSSLAWAGIAIDPLRNTRAAGRINAASSGCAVHVLRSEENQQMARHAWALR